jgi:hypothetical protein
MPDYRAYILGGEGHRFLRVAEFSRDHADDATALCAAKKLIDGQHDVEVWDGGRWSPGSIMWTAIRAMISHG